MSAAAASSDRPTYPYNSGDGRSQKATLEHIFPTGHGDVDIEATASSTASTSDRVQAPWSVGWQMNERNVMWSDDLKLRLIKVISHMSHCVWAFVTAAAPNSS